MKDRDRADETRADSPLTLDDRYELVETTRMTPEEVVSELERRVRRAFDSDSPRQ